MTHIHLGSNDIHIHIHTYMYIYILWYAYIYIYMHLLKNPVCPIMIPSVACILLNIFHKQHPVLSHNAPHRSSSGICSSWTSWGKLRCWAWNVEILHKLVFSKIKKPGSLGFGVNIKPQNRFSWGFPEQQGCSTRVQDLYLALVLDCYKQPLEFSVYRKASNSSLSVTLNKITQLVPSTIKWVCLKIGYIPNEIAI